MSAPSSEIISRPTPAARPAEGDRTPPSTFSWPNGTDWFRIAHRIVGDAAEPRTCPGGVGALAAHRPRGGQELRVAFLTTTTTRLAINVIQPGRRRHDAVRKIKPSRPR